MNIVLEKGVTNILNEKRQKVTLNNKTHGNHSYGVNIVGALMNIFLLSYFMKKK